MMVKESIPANGHTSYGKQLKDLAVGLESNEETADINRWRLRDEHGEQTWHYLETDAQVKAWPQTTADRYHLGLPLVLLPLSECSSPSKQD